MPSIMEDLARQLGGSNLSRLSQQLGADDETTSRAVAGALPMLLGALARNSSSADGASALSAALDRDHDGSILDDLGGLLGAAGLGRGGAATARRAGVGRIPSISPRGGAGGYDAGAKILGHVFGPRQARVESSLSRSTGLDAQSTAKLLAMLAPLVLGALGKTKREKRLDPRGLSEILQREERTATKAAPELGMLGSLIDQDGDGEVLDDLAKAGSGFLGRLLRG